MLERLVACNERLRKHNNKNIEVDGIARGSIIMDTLKVYWTDIIIKPGASEVKPASKKILNREVEHIALEGAIRQNVAHLANGYTVNFKGIRESITHSSFYLVVAIQLYQIQHEWYSAVNEG